jgi:hypothetical protein
VAHTQMLKKKQILECSWLCNPQKLQPIQMSINLRMGNSHSEIIHNQMDEGHEPTVW